VTREGDAAWTRKKIEVQLLVPLLIRTRAWFLARYLRRKGAPLGQNPVPPGPLPFLLNKPTDTCAWIRLTSAVWGHPSRPYKRHSCSRYVPSVSPILHVCIYAMSDHINTSSPLTSLPSSPVLQSIDDSPTDTNTSTYLSVPTVQVPDSTPIKHSLQTSEQFSASPPPPAVSLHPKLDVGMRQAFVGPMSVENFLSDFLPVKDAPIPSTSPAFTALAQATSEAQMYGIFVCSFNILVFFSLSYDTPPRPMP